MQVKLIIPSVGEWRVVESFWSVMDLADWRRCVGGGGGVGGRRCCSTSAGGRGTCGGGDDADRCQSFERYPPSLLSCVAAAALSMLPIDSSHTDESAPLAVVTTLRNVFSAGRRFFIEIRRPTTR